MAPCSGGPKLDAGACSRTSQKILLQTTKRCATKCSHGTQLRKNHSGPARRGDCCCRLPQGDMGRRHWCCHRPHVGASQGHSLEVAPEAFGNGATARSRRHRQLVSRHAGGRGLMKSPLGSSTQHSCIVDPAAGEPSNCAAAAPALSTPDALSSLERKREIERRSRAKARAKLGGAAARNRKYNEANREKHLAHKAVEKAVSRGHLTKMPCEACGETKLVHAHHDDYSRRLDVIWLCPLHHKQRHKILSVFCQPADDLRSHNTQTNHAAPASRSRRVAGPRGVHAYSVPPVITQSVNPASHSKAPFVSQAKDSLEGFAGWQKDLRAS